MAAANSKSLLVTGGATALGMTLLFFVVYQSFWLPYSTLRKELAQAEEELEAKNNELRDFMMKKKKLERARLTSFPMGVKHWLTEYDAYLLGLARNLKPHVTPPSVAAGSKPAPLSGKRTQADQVVLAWTVKGKGKWVDIVAFLEKFEHTPLMHRIKNIHIERPTGNSDEKKEEKKLYEELSFSVTIETLSLRNDKRPDNLWGIDGRVLAVDAFAGLGLGMPGWSMAWNGRMLAPRSVPPDRQYEAFGKYWNPFRGGLSSKEKASEWGDFPDGNIPDKKEAEKPAEKVLVLKNPESDMRRHVVLTMNVETTRDITVIVRPEGTKIIRPGPGPGSGFPGGGSGYPGSGFRFGPPSVVLIDDEPVELARDSTKTVELIVKLQTRQADRRADLVESVTPAGMGLSAEIARDRNGKIDGNLKISARKDVAEGSYEVKVKSKRAFLYNKLDEKSTPLLNRSGFESFGIWSEDGRVLHFRGTVLHIDNAGIFFLSRDLTKEDARDGIYRMYNGETVHQAMSRRLSAAEVQDLDWWALSPLTVSTLGLLSAPACGPLLAEFALYPGRPGLRISSESLESLGKSARMGK